MLLAVDTSTAWASVAAFDGRDVLAEETWRTGREHADELFSTIERVLARAGSAAPAVSAVAVATGPGSFTGLRVAIAAAQGIARGSGAALVGVSTLDVIAHAHATAAAPTCAVLPAGRGDHYAAFYGGGDGGWRRRSPISAGPLSSLASGIDAPTLFAGELDDDDRRMLRDLLAERALFAGPAMRLRRAAHLADLGQRALDETPASQLPAVEPLYVRSPAIGAPSRGS